MEIYSNLADVVVHKTYGTYIFNIDIHTTFTKMLFYKTIYNTGIIFNTYLTISPTQLHNTDYALPANDYDL